MDTSYITGWKSKSLHPPCYLPQILSVAWYQRTDCMRVKTIAVSQAGVILDIRIRHWYDVYLTSSNIVMLCDSSLNQWCLIYLFHNVQVSKGQHIRDDTKSKLAKYVHRDLLTNEVSFFIHTDPKKECPWNWWLIMVLMLMGYSMLIKMEVALFHFTNSTHFRQL